MAFKKGTSGNPSGRPAGKTSAGEIRQAIEQESTAILKAVIDAAVLGDMQAAKILIDRLCPQLKPMALPVTIPVGDTLPESGANVIFAMLGGQLPPDVGAQIITALAHQSKLIETLELSERLARLETQLKIQNT